MYSFYFIPLALGTIGFITCIGIIIFIQPAYQSSLLLRSVEKFYENTIDTSPANPMNFPSDFYVRIARERERADRGGHIFSLMLFDLGLFGNNPSINRRFLDLLESRLRMIDEIIPCGRTRFGVILPYTSSHDTMKIAENIKNSAPCPAQAVSFEVYSYPENWKIHRIHDESLSTVSVASA